MKRRATFLLCLLATPALSAQCPDPPDHAKALTELIETAQEAPNERAARRAFNEMWALWTDAPDRHAQELLNEGMERREVGDLSGAIKAFDALVAYCPDYAEGYNQRAFINFKRQDYADALPDLNRAIELSPRHIGALSGRALTLLALGRQAEATVTMRRALELNPWLPERHLLPQIETPGKDL
ncbi:tetratricopeptide repeat protein [Roseovarius salinarum]|uniref:tetratricopeptide repeat protein n=1 Tax=Roseovarius salinarum TaxID=1981892 RepID=UPI000C339A38|nr:tetratricopeptide repeat protein [Roseovarius salinarum]